MQVTVQFPAWAIGRTIPEDRLKAGLRRLQPLLHFDYASRRGERHPDQDYRQGVYFGGFPEGAQHVCSMDRGAMTGGHIAEAKIWTTAWDMVTVPFAEVAVKSEEFVLVCFENPEMCQVKRPVRQHVFLSGWRHTLKRLMARRIPGVTAASFEAEFGLTLGPEPPDVDLPPGPTVPWEADVRDDDDPEVLAEMGTPYQARPTIVFPGETGWGG